MKKDTLRKLIKEVIQEMSPITPTMDQKQFANDIAQKIRERRMKKGSSDLGMDEAVRQMIEHKLYRENWVKGGGRPPSEADKERWRKEMSHPPISI